jgi:hypothetical protein
VSAALRAELERIDVTYAKAGAAAYVQFSDFGATVWFKGPPLSGLSWTGPRAVALDRLATMADAAGPEPFWRALQDGAD